MSNSAVWITQWLLGIQYSLAEQLRLRNTRYGTAFPRLQTAQLWLTKLNILQTYPLQFQRRQRPQQECRSESTPSQLICDASLGFPKPVFFHFPGQVLVGQFRLGHFRP